MCLCPRGVAPALLSPGSILAAPSPLLLSSMCRHDWNDEEGTTKSGYVTEDKGVQPGPGLWEQGSPSSCQESLKHKAAEGNSVIVCGRKGSTGELHCIGRCCLVLEIARRNSLPIPTRQTRVLVHLPSSPYLRSYLTPPPPLLEM